MPSRIVVTKHQATLIEEAVRLVLLMVGRYYYSGRTWREREMGGLVPTDWPGSA